jgi:hypothetical protein
MGLSVTPERLFQHYRPFSDLTGWPDDVRSRGRSGLRGKTRRLPFRPWRSPQRAIAIGAAAPDFRRAAAEIRCGHLFEGIAQFEAAEKRPCLCHHYGHNPYINAIMSPIVVRVYRPVTVRPRQRSALTLSDGSLICLTGTALLRAGCPASVHHAGRQGFVPTSCEKMNATQGMFRQRNTWEAVRSSRNLLSFASADGVLNNGSSASQRLAAARPLTDGGGRFAI